MELDIKIGDIILGGKFKNKRIVVNKIGTDELGQPIINKNRKLLSVRIEKNLPEGMWSSKTLAEKYKDKGMDKKAYLKEVYDASFNDELEKLSGRKTDTALGATVGAGYQGSKLLKDIKGLKFISNFMSKKDIAKGIVKSVGKAGAIGGTAALGASLLLRNNKKK